MESKRELMGSSLDAEMATFNRTSMESKRNQAPSNQTSGTFNRTSMESKQALDDAMNISEVTFNRTSMESKRSSPDRADIVIMRLLIEPVWNRNF